MKTFKDSAIEIMNNIENIATQGTLAGESTGFKALDELTAGISVGEIWSVVSSPVIPKELLVHSMISNWARKDKSPTVLSYLSQRSEVSMGMSVLASTGLIRKRNLIACQLGTVDWPKGAHAADILSKKKILSKNVSFIDVKDIKRYLATLKTEKNLPEHTILFIDSFKSITLGKKQKLNASNRLNQIEQALFHLKQTLREYNASAIILQDLSAKMERRPNKRPFWTDMVPEGESLYCISDVVLGLYIDEFYNRQTEDKGIAEIIVLKNTKGETDTVRVAYVPEYDLFCNVGVPEGTKEQFSVSPVSDLRELSKFDNLKLEKGV